MKPCSINRAKSHIATVHKRLTERPEGSDPTSDFKVAEVFPSFPLKGTVSPDKLRFRRTDWYIKERFCSKTAIALAGAGVTPLWLLMTGIQEVVRFKNFDQSGRQEIQFWQERNALRIMELKRSTDAA